MHGTKCSDVMTKDLTCCVPTDTVHVAAQSMKAQNVGAMPVIDSHEKKKLVGIVTDRDLVRRIQLISAVHSLCSDGGSADVNSRVHGTRCAIHRMWKHFGLHRSLIGDRVVRLSGAVGAATTGAP